MKGAYDDILFLPRPVSSRHRPMPPENRAAQFAPFAALTGYEGAIAEAGRQTAAQIRPCQEELQLLDLICQSLTEQTQISVVHFIPDSKKTGGQYKLTTGILKRIEQHSQSLLLTDGTCIALDTVVSITPEGSGAVSEF